MEPSYRFADEKKMSQVFSKLRCWPDTNSYPNHMGPFKITRIRDVTTGFDSAEKDKKSKFPLQPSGQMITFWFDNGATVTLRNSGTEPKLKYYIEAKHDKDPKEARAIVDSMSKVLLKDFMQMEEK
ncbi:Phosphoglucomutase-2 [Reticulomyxa filosa]|uniref:Phosphoglucomutase-2 n=1 Tax=Reticulomyxa filosa TaxID=46433 RepID=X6MUJ8_RETFI|nr:Phosphoglucomutase-2 [Reticulomyxa filosa]|eukprot:ETO17663.1 Phosphoglucomutase-2 [Reticulomyxa filosa]